MFSSILLITCGTSVDVIKDSTYDLDIGSAVNKGYSVSSQFALTYLFSERKSQVSTFQRGICHLDKPLYI